KPERAAGVQHGPGAVGGVTVRSPGCELAVRVHANGGPDHVVRGDRGAAAPATGPDDDTDDYRNDEKRRDRDGGARPGHDLTLTTGSNDRQTKKVRPLSGPGKKNSPSRLRFRPPHPTGLSTWDCSLTV